MKTQTYVQAYVRNRKEKVNDSYPEIAIALYAIMVVGILVATIVK